MTKEIVWTYLVARKYENDHKTLCNLLCGQNEEMPNNSKIWLEAYLHPTRMRQEEVQYWRSRADLSMGHLEGVEDRQLQIRSNGNSVCICESKWSEDIRFHQQFPGINQLSQMIEHAPLLHDKHGNFPERVYVTLITPQYVKKGSGVKAYSQIFNKYYSDRRLLEEDLRKCPLHFLDYDTETLVRRVSHLRLNWVTFEELLGLSDLVSQIKSARSWEGILKEMGREELFYELTK